MEQSSLILVVVSFLLFISAQARSVVLCEEDAELEKQLKMLNKPYLKSFKDNYRVTFDCVDMYKQPAFDHPLLKNHKIQTWASSRPVASSAVLLQPQEHCPNGTVPIRRTTRGDLQRARSSAGLFKPDMDTSTVAGQHFAQMKMKGDKELKFVSAGAVIDVYSLGIQRSQVSTAQIILVDASSSKVSTVQAGWHVDPELEPDGQTRFLVYWTADGYQTTGCVNLLCPGFVVTSQTMAPGMLLGSKPISLQITKDSVTGNWRVDLEKELVGYFPAAIVNQMSGGTEVHMGGVVYAPPPQRSPPMGSGVKPVAGGNSPAAKFTWIRLYGGQQGINWRTAMDSTMYNVVPISDSQTGPEGIAFQYGGPGGA